MENNLKLKLKSLQGFLAEQKKVAEIIYLTAFVIYVTCTFVYGTMIPLLISNGLIYYLMEFSGILVALKIFILDANRWKYEKLAIILLTGIIFWAAYKNSFEPNYFYYYLYILGARDIKFEKVIKAFLITLAILILTTILLTLSGTIPNITVMRSSSSAVRYSLGMIYPTDFSARIFYVLLIYALLRKFKLTLPEYISYFSIMFLMYFLTDTRIDFLLTFIFILVLLGRKIVFNLLEKCNAKLLFVLSLLFILFNVFLAYIYSPHNLILNIINKLLSGRLIFGKLAFENYNVTFFGQYIPQIGNGGIHHEAFNYFYIDVSFIRVLLMEGFFCFVMLLYIIWRLINRYYYFNMPAFTVVLLFVILSSVIDQHLLELSFNIIFLSAFADLSYWETSTSLKLKG